MPGETQTAAATFAGLGITNVLVVDASDTNAYATIAAALAAATSGQQVWVAPGTYTESGLTVPAGVLVDLRFCTWTTNAATGMALGNGATVLFHQINCAAGDTAFTVASGVRAYVKGDVTVATGAAGVFANVASGGTLWAEVDSISDGSGTITGYIVAGTLFHRGGDLGCTTNFDVNAGTVYAVVERSAGATAYDVDATGNLYLTARTLTGTETIADGAQVVLNIADRRSGRAEEIDDGDSPYTLADNDGIGFLRCDTSSAAITVNLPTAADNKDRVIFIKNSDTGANGKDLTIDGEGAETIDGAATKTAEALDSYGLWCDGTEWWIV